MVGLRAREGPAPQPVGPGAARVGHPCRDDPVTGILRLWGAVTFCSGNGCGRDGGAMFWNGWREFQEGIGLWVANAGSIAVR